VLIVKYILRDISARQTNATGVQTTATITAADINGMVNYVQHQRLTRIANARSSSATSRPPGRSRGRSHPLSGEGTERSCPGSLETELS
jgi:hypothetical protein